MLRRESKILSRHFDRFNIDLNILKNIENFIYKSCYIYSNNRLKAAYMTRFGKPHGIFLQYYKNGNMMKDINYLNGKLHGNYTEYWENGELFCKTVYKNNKIDGLFSSWDIE